MKEQAEVSTLFNVMLFTYLMFNGVLRALFSYEHDQQVIWDQFFNRAPWIAGAGAMLLLLISVIWGGALVRHFWNTFVSSVFGLRTIRLAESIALVTLAAIVLS